MAFTNNSKNKSSEKWIWGRNFPPHISKALSPFNVNNAINIDSWGNNVNFALLDICLHCGNKSFAISRKGGVLSCNYADPGTVLNASDDTFTFVKACFSSESDSWTIMRTNRSPSLACVMNDLNVINSGCVSKFLTNERTYWKDSDKSDSEFI